MDWVKLHTRYYADARVEALPDADTELMFVRGLARAGEVGRAGFIPEESLPRLARRRRYAASVSALLASGLWTRASGGYQVTNWDHWQDALDALTRRRTADRERKRAVRAAEREALVQRDGERCRRCGTAENLVLSRGDADEKYLLCWSCSAHKRNATEAEYDAWLAEMHDPPPDDDWPEGTLSADMSADVRPLEKEKDKEGVQVGDIAHPPRAREAPPSRCPEHVDDPDPPNCGRCADARREHERWQHNRERELALAESARRSKLAHDRAIASRAAVDVCRQCDDKGYLANGVPCPHDPDAPKRFSRGYAAAKAVLDAKVRSPPDRSDPPPDEPPPDPNEGPA